MSIFIHYTLTSKLNKYTVFAVTLQRHPLDYIVAVSVVCQTLYILQGDKVISSKIHVNVAQVRIKL